MPGTPSRGATAIRRVLLLIRAFFVLTILCSSRCGSHRALPSVDRQVAQGQDNPLCRRTLSAFHSSSGWAWMRS